MNLKLTILIIFNSLAFACQDDVRIKLVSGKKSACSIADGSCATIERVSPLVAKPGSEVKVYGKNLDKLLSLAVDGAEIKVTLLSATALSFVMPDGKSGFVAVKSMDNASLSESNSQKIYRRADAGYPVITGEPSLVCDDIRFLDAEGELAIGTKDCSEEAMTGLENLKPENIKAGIMIDDVTGTVQFADAVSGCTADGVSGCVANATYKALPIAGLAEKIIVGQTVAGVAGSVALPPATMVLAAQGFGPSINPVFGSLTLPPASAVRSSAGAYGAGGSGTTPLLGDCQVDGDIACVALAPTYAAMLKAGAQNKLLSGQTLGGVAGNVTLPAVGKVLSGINFGIAGAGLSGTLNLPLAADVKSGTAVFGDPGSALTPAYSLDFPSIANVRSIDTVDGVAGTLLDCTANAGTNCVTTTTYKAADLSNLTAAHIKSGVSIAGLTGDFPSASNPLASATSTTDLTSFSSATATGSYEFFDSTGARYTGSVADGGTITAGTSDQTLSAASTFYRQVIVAGDSDLAASNIQNAVQLFGITGNFTTTPPTCSADGESSCVVDGTNHKAAVLLGAADKIISTTTLAGVSGNVLLPAAGKVLTSTSYGVSGTGTSGTLTLPLAADVKTGTAAYGEPGSLLTPSYSPDFPALSNVRDTDTVDGTAGTLLSCTAGNQTGCVATATYKTLDLSSATAMTDLTLLNFNASLATASNFEYWDSSGARHQLTGNAGLIATNILTGTTIFGASGSATPAPANCSGNGAQSCVATGSYFAGTACTANASNCFLPSYAATTQPLKAISYDAIDAGKASIRDALTLAGITGTLNDCSSDGDDDCVVVGPSYAVLLKAGAADKIISGNTIGSVAGTVTLPAVGKVLTSTSFGVSGTGSSGSLTLPLATNVKTGSGAYGDPSSQITPSYSPDFPAVANVLSTDTVDSASGTLTLPAVGKVLTGTSFGSAGNGSSGSLTLPLAADVKTGTAAYGEPASQLTPSYSPDFPSVGNVHTSDTVDGATGTLTLPAIGKVLTATSYGLGGNGSTGSLTLPLAADVKTGTAAYGEPSSQLTPAYSPDFPAVGNVLAADTVDGANGTLTLPAAAKVLDSTIYGAAGNSLTGSLTLPLAADVKTGTAAYGETGSLLTPSYSPDLPLVANVRNNDTVDGATGTLLDCAAGGVAGCVTTATYRTMDLSSATAMTDLTLTNFNATIITAGNFEFWDAAGARHQVAGDADLAAANVASSTTIFGVAGSAAISPANCSANGSQSCVATGSYYAATACAANGSNCFLPTFVTSTQPLKAISYDAIDAGKASIRTSLTLSGIAGTLADCSAGNTSGCVTTPTYKSINLSAAGTDTGLTAANFQTRLATAANSEFWDASGARHSIAGDADLSVDKLLAGAVIHGVTGQYPSASYPLASDTAATDLTLFTSQLTTNGSFEFFDSAGAKYTGTGDSDLVNANIKNNVAIGGLSLTGSYAASLTCPTGWIKVPGDSAYGTGDFCVMKYEAKEVSTVATSQAALAPWISITHTASITKCRALGTGYDIISNPQWMTIGSNVAGINGNWSGGTAGSGSLFAGHNDSDPYSDCEASSDDALFYVEYDCNPVSSGDTAEQRRTLTLSNSNVIWDLSGNVNEWVNYLNRGDKPGATNAWYEYTVVTGTTTTALKDLIPTNAVKAFWSNTWNSTKYVGRFYPGTNGSGGALLRGGNWIDGSDAGVFAANLFYAPSASDTAFGFRCAASPSP